MSRKPVECDLHITDPMEWQWNGYDKYLSLYVISGKVHKENTLALNSERGKKSVIPRQIRMYRKSAISSIASSESLILELLRVGIRPRVRSSPITFHWKWLSSDIGYRERSRNRYVLISASPTPTGTNNRNALCSGRRRSNSSNYCLCDDPFTNFLTTIFRTWQRLTVKGERDISQQRGLIK